MQVRQALELARAAGVDRLDAQWLLSHLLKRSRAALLAHDDAALDDRQAAAFRTGIARRAAGEPLAYVVGHTCFRGLELAVSPSVLIPRPETELLVEWALQLRGAAVDAIDLGTGSGAVAIALAREAPGLRVTATDLSPEALEIARRNIATHGLPVEVVQGAWWAAVPNRRFGLAVSNPPYVAADDPHLPALSHEPSLALTPGGDDSLAALRELICGAPRHLRPGAWLLVEHSHDQAVAVEGLLGAAGLTAMQMRCDLAGLPRCSAARWAGSDVNN